MLDPYETLGVGPDATEDEVRRAYRKAAKRAHPDGGGCSEMFESLSRSLALLTDVKRRAHYDRTGQWQEAEPDNPLSGSMSVLMLFLDQVMTDYVSGKGLDPTTVDLIPHAKKFIQAKLASLKQTKAMAEKHIATIEKVAERFSVKEGPNRIAAGLKWQAAKIRKELEPLFKDIESHEQALALLADYSFRFDAQTWPTPSTAPPGWVQLGQGMRFFQT